MYLRKFRRTKDGKHHVYWGLVESIRAGGRTRQRVVCYLGDLEEERREAFGELARRVEGRSESPPDMFAPAERRRPARTIEIDPERVAVERVRDFGDAFAGLALWRQLGLDRFFGERIERGREAVDWPTMIAYEAVARFCSGAGGELAVAEGFTDRSALCDLLGVDPGRINKDRLYRTLDEALRHKDALCEHLKKSYSDLFGIEYDLLLYDLTSTFFEGGQAANPQAARGYSRDGRPDCKQVVIALVVTREGLPLTYEVFDGNRADVTTVREIIGSVEARFGRAGRVWVMDRGMSSRENLDWMRARGALYLIGTPKSMLQKFEKELTETGWREAREGVEVKLVRAPDNALETFVLCRSAGRRDKELAMIGRFAQRIEEGLAKIQEACRREARPLRDRLELGKRLGALMSANTRAARLFDVRVEEIEAAQGGGLRLSWTRRQGDGQSWAERSAGHYLLRTNLDGELSADELWKAYINLTQVEEAFRKLKTDLGLRPVHHQKEDRVQAHIFICFLALAMLKTFEMNLERWGLGRSPMKVLGELRAWRSMDVVLPTTDGPALRRRLVAKPEPALKILLQRMGLRPPKLTQTPPSVVKTLPSKIA